MTAVGRSATPGRLLDQDPVQSVVGAVVAVVDVSTRPRHVTRGALTGRVGHKHFQSSGSDETTNCRAVPDTVVQISNMPTTPNI